MYEMALSPENQLGAYKFISQHAKFTVCCIQRGPKISRR